MILQMDLRPDGVTRRAPEVAKQLCALFVLLKDSELELSSKNDFLVTSRLALYAEAPGSQRFYLRRAYDYRRCWVAHRSARS